ncbi:MAG: HAD-IC family P-type ATPase, partial [Geminicoccaceae bacterium]|nr:HAD-IC family P-type ATPase [Geminicoccaceae bacterium]
LAAGKTVVVVERDGVVVGVLALADELRPRVGEAIAALRQLGIREIELLTGDHERAAAALGRQLGIRWRARLLPDQKLAIVRDYQAAGRVVVMVGDGINDAPALAAADLGIAMGSGTDVAIAAAGFTLMRPDPRLVPAALSIARATRRTIRQNLFWAFLYNLLALPLAALGFLTPAVAGSAMALSSLSVVLNALRLARWRPDFGTAA